MPIGPLISGLASLAGSGMAMYKCIRDDKMSRYPPEYMIYRDMMKMCQKGYPMNPMMMRMMCQPPQQPMLNPMMMPQQNGQFCMLPTNDPNQQLVNAVAIALQQYQQQNQQQQLVNQIVQLINGMTQQNNRVVGWSPPPQPMVQQPIMNQNLLNNFQFQMPDFSSMATKQLWDTPADGGTGSSYQPIQNPPVLVRPPMNLTPPPPRVEVVQPPPRPTCQVTWCNPQEMVQNPEPYQHPMYVNRELTWDTPNMYSVDQQGFRSFMDRMEQRSYYSDDGSYGNVW
jgi:hypothetical protein